MTRPRREHSKGHFCQVDSRLAVRLGSCQLLHLCRRGCASNSTMSWQSCRPCPCLASALLADQPEVRCNGEGCGVAVARDHADPHTASTQGAHGIHDALPRRVVQTNEPYEQHAPTSSTDGSSGSSGSSCWQQQQLLRVCLWQARAFCKR
jgi:hypothetical protein